ncbi:MAG TPA: hypothetical protein VFA09_13270 [Ktedonobacteraceae bacterium]|nr:hypothetical protein [Ktedonobacteraceae bacterium]
MPTYRNGLVNFDDRIGDSPRPVGTAVRPCPAAATLRTVQYLNVPYYRMNGT